MELLQLYGSGYQSPHRPGAAAALYAVRYISNLGPSISRDQLSQLFSSCGAIRCITIPRSPQHPQQTLGHAYIEFSSPEEVEAAVKLHRQVGGTGS